jgi:hypothetical protein
LVQIGDTSYRYQLEREFRTRVRTAEEKLRAECMADVTENARNAILQRDELTDFIYKMGENLNVVNR